MTVFKTFFKVLIQYKAMVILYTVMLVGFAIFNFTSNETVTSFTSTKPDVVIFNNDKDSKLSQTIYSYMENNANIKEVDSVDDALFYRDVNYVITIPDGYAANFMLGKQPNIEVKTSGDYNSSYANMLLDKFLKIANTYRLSNYSEEDICTKTNEVLKDSVEVNITSKLDTNALSKTSFYFSFLSYAILAGSVFIIAMAMSSFKESKIRKRTLISSTKINTYNKSLFLGSCIFGVTLWLLYAIISIVLLKDTMLSMNGLLYIINSFIFMICCLTIAFLIGNVIRNKEAIGGIVNVVALGSSFLCGAFIPISYLPDSVLVISRFIPTYWYVQNNELISKLETFDFNSLMPLITNSLIILIFIVVFIVLTNIISKKIVN